MQVKQDKLMNRVKSIVIFIALACGTLAAMSCISRAPLFTFGDVHDEHTSIYTVVRGDTLDSIAMQSDPDDYIQAVVSWIEHHNHLGDGYLQPGQTLVVPVN